MTLPLFLADAVPASGSFTLDGPEGRHAAAVRRLRAGEELMVSDGRGTVARCTVTAVGKDSLELTVEERWTEPAPSPRVVVAQALVKGDRGELAVELATEAGADEIIPWRARRSIAKWEDGPRGDKALAKWRSTAREAGKQSRRPWLPEVTEPADLRTLSQRVGECAAALVLEAGVTTPLAAVDLPTEGDILLVIGPEGGIDPLEIDALTSAGATLVRLGPSVLRTSTAAAVALGALGALTPRWR